MSARRDALLRVLRDQLRAHGDAGAQLAHAIGILTEDELGVLSKARKVLRIADAPPSNKLKVIEGVTAVLLKWRAHGPPISAVNWEHQQQLIHAELFVSQLCKNALGGSLHPVLMRDELSNVESLSTFAKDVPLVDRMTSIKIYEHPSRQTCAGSDMRFGPRDRISVGDDHLLACHQCSKVWTVYEIRPHRHTKELLIPLHLAER